MNIRTQDNVLYDFINPFFKINLSGLKGLGMVQGFKVHGLWFRGLEVLGQTQRSWSLGV